MNESRKSLPPISALNSFVAAARYGSFSRAGEQIGLTQSAISRQIALLEDWLQTGLFDRHGRRVVLNSAGHAYLDQVRPALDRIREATEQVVNRTGGRELNIATLPSFGMRWLAPRLPDLTARFPDLMVNFTTRSFSFDLRGEGFDAAIHFGQPDWPDASHLSLFHEQVVAVCSPDWLAANPLEGPEDLMGKPLLFQASRRSAWSRWFASQGLKDIPTLKGPLFEQFLMLAQAAASGAGAALIPRFLIEPELAQGTLVIPFDHMLKSEDAYYLVRRADWQSNAAMLKFSEWIAEQVRI